MMEHTKQLEGKTIGILGTGYIGKNLMNYLNTNQNIEVKVFNRDNLADIKKYTFDYFYNCAGNTGDFRKDLKKTIESNLFLNIYLLDNLKITNSFIYLSSTRLYGFSDKKDVVFKEDHQTNENHLSIDYIYDGSKKLTESYLINKSTEFNVVICRISNVYGNYTIQDLDDSTYLKVLLKKYVTKDIINIKQNILSEKDYIFIHDALKGIIQASLFKEEKTIFNIATGNSYSLKSWINYLGLEYEIDSQEKSHPLYSSIDISKANKLLNFNTVFNLENLTINDILK